MSQAKYWNWKIIRTGDHTAEIYESTPGGKWEKKNEISVDNVSPESQDKQYLEGVLKEYVHPDGKPKHWYFR